MIPLIPIAGLVLVVWWLSSSAAIAELSGTLTLSSAQDAIRRRIEARAGWLGPALVANAYAESSLDPMQIGDGGDSVGLWQLNARGGGAGMSVEARQDVDTALTRILALCHAEPAITGARGTATHADLAELVAHHVERCAACGHNAGSSELWRRRRLVATLYGAALAELVPE